MTAVPSKTLAVAVMLVAASASAAQPYPSKPIRMVVGYEPGGGADNIARLLAGAASEILGQQIVVDNRSGANGVVAAELVSRAPKDGYTIHVVTSSHVTNPSVHRKLPYDTARDFAAAPLVMVVHPAMKAGSVADFITAAKAGDLHYASAGLGNMTQVAAELFNLTTGTRMIHVPFKGSGPAIIDLIAGRVAVYFPPVPSAIAQIQAGRLKALAVTSLRPASNLPGVPTVHESGFPGFEAGSWYGLVVPPGTATQIVQRLLVASRDALQTSRVQERMKMQGLEAVGSTPAQFDAKIRRDIEKWRKVFREAKIVMQ